MRADIREVERLLLGPLRAAPRGRWTRSVGGRWSPIQVIEHVALGVDMSARGLEQRREAGPMARRRFGIGVRAAAWALLTTGYIPPGFKAPAFSAPAERPEPERVRTLLLDGVARVDALPRGARAAPRWAGEAEAGFGVSARQAGPARGRALLAALLVPVPALLWWAGVLAAQDTVRTPYADIVIVPSDPGAAARVAAFVDTGYVRLRAYTGYDLNSLMNAIRGNPDVHQPRYLFEVLPPERMWIAGWRGGLTAWNHSQIATTLLPGLSADSALAGHVGVAILWHELGNGWANVFVDYRGADTNLPWWFASEGHAGFWKQHILTDEGLGTEAVREYGVALTHYDRFLRDPGCIRRQGAERCDPGSVTHVMLESLWRAHGWAPLRAAYDAVQRGELLFPSGDDGREATGRIAFEISRAVRRDLTPWLGRHHQGVPPAWAARIRAGGWPPDSIPTARDVGWTRPPRDD